MGDRVILHVDMNAFYASVETLYHPEAKDRPMAVCGDVESRRGIILARNQLARERGVTTAEPVWQAQRKCPGLLLLPPHHDLYRDYSRRANEIYGRYTDLVEPVSIDESYLDVTGSRELFGDGRQIADDIRRAVREELGLTVSVGVSFCKVFAKLGSDYKKPDATTVLLRENYQGVVYPLPVTDLWSVGGKTAARLESLGIRTIGELAALDEKTLVSHFGKHGRAMYVNAHGLDDEPVRGPDEREPVKSIGNGMTFRRNITGEADVRAGTLHLCETVGARLRGQGLRCTGVQVSIKDPNLRTIDRQMHLDTPTHRTRDLFDCAMKIIARSWKPGAPIRLISVTAIGLVSEEEGEQLSLFAGEGGERLEALDRSVDDIRRRFGPGALRPASVLRNDIGIEE